MDLFTSIFGDSSSESSEAESDDEKDISVPKSTTQDANKAIEPTSSAIPAQGAFAPSEKYIPDSEKLENTEQIELDKPRNLSAEANRNAQTKVEDTFESRLGNTENSVKDVPGQEKELKKLEDIGYYGPALPPSVSVIGELSKRLMDGWMNE